MGLIRDAGFYRRLAALALPVAVQSLLAFAVGFADGLMVEGLGDAAISGVYIGGQLQNLVQMLSGGVEGTILILAAQHLGRGDRDSAAAAVVSGMQLSLCAGLVLAAAGFVLPGQILSLFTGDAGAIDRGTAYLRVAALSYPFFCLSQALTAGLRSAHRPYIGMLSSLCCLAANILLNRLFIDGGWGLPAMGTAGAALATLIARMLEAAVILIYALCFDKALGLRLRELISAANGRRLSFLRQALPVVGGQLVWSANNMAASAILGRFGGSVITAAGIANSMNSLAYLFTGGLATAIGILTAEAVGAGRRDEAKSIARTVQLILAGMGLLSFGAIRMLARPFVGLYAGASPEAAATALRFISLLSIAMIGTCYQQAGLYGLVKAGGDTGFVFRMDAIFVFLIVLPGALLALRAGASPEMVYACLKADQILKCPVAAIKINRFKWMKRLADEA